MLKKILKLSCMLLLAACSWKNVKYSYPKNDYDKKIERGGSLATSDKTGGFDIFKSRTKKDEAPTIAMNVNSILYRAALDVVSFMPLLQSDPIGGVIITDWYSDPSTPYSKIKLNIMILDKELKANALKVNGFRQVMDKNGNWISAEVSQSFTQDIELKIINKARQYNLEEKAK